MYEKPFPYLWPIFLWNLTRFAQGTFETSHPISRHKAFAQFWHIQGLGLDIRILAGGLDNLKLMTHPRQKTLKSLDGSQDFSTVSNGFDIEPSVKVEDNYLQLTPLESWKSKNYEGFFHVYVTSN